MSTPPKTNDITASNLEAWEQVAPIHNSHNRQRLLERFSKPGFSVLDEVEVRVLETLNFKGKDIAQVCCNNGQELISVKSLGAGRCVGFDGAQGFLDQGAELATAAGLDVEFVCCDAYDLPADYYGAFDIVTITIGVLGWMPDLAGFFASVAKLLRPGGALFIYEHHPIVVMIRPDGPDAPIEWELSYFHEDPYVETDGLDYYGGTSYDAKPATSFCHKMSDIIMAGVQTGMAIEHFEERPKHISMSWYNVEKSGIGLPMSYTLVFRKSL